jgi:protein dispatched 1
MEGVGTRSERTQQALVTLGVSILAGANTTNLAGVWLWCGTMVFFNKFAFLINMTICSALLWSLVFFPAACIIAGPENDFGSWKRMLSWLANKLYRRSSRVGSATPAADSADRAV